MKDSALKWLVVVCVVLLFALGCATVKEGLAGLLDTAEDVNAGIVENAEPLKESSNPYVALAASVVGMLGAGTAALIQKAKASKYLKNIDATEKEKELAELLARTLATAIENSDASSVKTRVEAATKHNPALIEALKPILAEVSGAANGA